MLLDKIVYADIIKIVN